MLMFPVERELAIRALHEIDDRGRRCRSHGEHVHSAENRRVASKIQEDMRQALGDESWAHERAIPP